MEKVQPTKFQCVALGALLLIQTAHSLYQLISDTLFRILNPSFSMVMRYKTGIGWISEIPPWQQRMQWTWLSFWCAAIVFEMVLWFALFRARRYLWPFITIMVASLFLYESWTIGLGFDFAVDHILAVLFLGTLPFGLASLWRSRKAFSIGSMQIVQLALAMLVSAIVVHASGRYFGHGSIEWEGPIFLVNFVNIVAMSDFTYPQESSLVLGWCSYALVAALFWVVSKLRPKRIR
jgi:hypothetical protein